MLPQLEFHLHVVVCVELFLGECMQVLLARKWASRKLPAFGICMHRFDFVRESQRGAHLLACMQVFTWEGTEAVGDLVFLRGSSSAHLTLERGACAASAIPCLRTSAWGKVVVLSYCSGKGRARQLLRSFLLGLSACDRLLWKSHEDLEFVSSDHCGLAGPGRVGAGAGHLEQGQRLLLLGFSD